MSGVEFVLAGMFAAATPFLLAALGELVVERAGVLNLGVEGLMALGSVIPLSSSIMVVDTCWRSSLAALAQQCCP